MDPGLSTRQSTHRCARMGHAIAPPALVPLCQRAPRPHVQWPRPRAWPGLPRRGGRAPGRGHAAGERPCAARAWSGRAAGNAPARTCAEQPRPPSCAGLRRAAEGPGGPRAWAACAAAGRDARPSPRRGQCRRARASEPRARMPMDQPGPRPRAPEAAPTLPQGRRGHACAEGLCPPSSAGLRRAAEDPRAARRCSPHHRGGGALVPSCTRARRGPPRLCPRPPCPSLLPGRGRRARLAGAARCRAAAPAWPEPRAARACAAGGLAQGAVLPAAMAVPRPLPCRRRGRPWLRLLFGRRRRSMWWAKP